MRRNFQFDHFTVVRWRDKLIDLHNAYDLATFGTDLSGGEVVLDFRRNEHALRPDELPVRVSLTCTGNVKVAFNDLTSIAAPLDKEGIELAYFDADCDWLSFLDEDLIRTHEPLGLHLMFSNRFTIRIFCDEVVLAAQ